MANQRPDESESGTTAPMAQGIGAPMARRLENLRGWCRDHPKRCLAAGFVLLTIGGLLFLAATGRRSLGIAVLLALIAPLVGALGLLLINEPISGYVRANIDRGRRLGVIGFAAGLGVVGIAVAIESPLLAVVGTVVVLLALLAINAWLLAGSRSNHTLLLVGGLVLLVMAPIMVWVGDGLDGMSIAAVVPWVAGLVLFKVGLPPWIDADIPGRRLAATIVSVVAFGLGVVLLYLSSRSFNEGALLFGVMLVIAGLSAVGIVAARYEPGIVRAMVLLAIGLLAIAAGAWLIDGIVGLLIVTALVTVVVAAIGAWFVFRGEALIAVLLLGFVVAWVLVDRTTDIAVDPNPGAELTILSIGDSYISGEGAPEFFPGTNVVGQNGNQCRRAPTAYSYLAAERLDAGLLFLACSGARSTDIDNQGRLPDPLPAVPGNEDQIQRLLAANGDQVADIDLVLVSIGGNDVGFGTIIKACLLPESCAIPELNEPWLRNVAETRQQLVAVFETLRATVGADTPIVAMLYPLIVAPDDGCGLAIGVDEIDFVVEFTGALNTMVTEAANEAGINVFDGTVNAFDGRLLCDDDPATNFFHLGPTEGPIADTLLPSNWVHGTLHPRIDGHRLIADRLVSPDGGGYLVDLLAATDAGGPANPEPGDGPGPGIPQYEELPDQQWVEEQLYGTVGNLVLPLGLLLIGGLIAAFGVVKARLPFLSFLDPSNNRRTETT